MSEVLESNGVLVKACAPPSCGNCVAAAAVCAVRHPDNDEVLEVCVRCLRANTGRVGWPYAEDVLAWLDSDARSAAGSSAGSAWESVPGSASESASESAVSFPVGSRVRLRHDVDRFPHFVAPAGAVGTVVYSDEEGFSVRLDEPLQGAEEWDNEVHWYPEHGPEWGDAVPARDLETVTPEACYVLVEWSVDEARGDWDEVYSCDETGDVMVFGEWENAVGMARFILGADGDDEVREPRPGMLPFIGILGCDSEATARGDGSEGEARACGWVTLDGAVHEGDYEVDAALWDSADAFVKAGAGREDSPPRARMLDEAVTRAKREILSDIGSGRVPASVASFSELHDYVDANEYGGLCDTYAGADNAFAAEVQDEVDGWLKQGRPSPPRCFMVARFDVTGLSESERDVLAGEVQAQAEASDDERGFFGEDGSPGHPDVEVEVSFEDGEVR